MKNRRRNEGIWCSLAGLALALGACGGEPLGDDLGEASSATDPWGWCVDHPCPNLEVVGYGGCPFSQGLLLVGVQNVGNLTAIPTKTRVEFLGATRAETVTRIIDTDSLSPGDIDAYWMGAPTAWTAGCTADVCRWRVTADAGDRVNEVDGTNNVRMGVCWFP